jgi:hypothetical protein
LPFGLGRGGKREGGGRAVEKIDGFPRRFKVLLAGSVARGIEIMAKWQEAVKSWQSVA